MLLNKFLYILKNSKCPESQKVELKKSDALNINFCKLNCNGIVVQSKRSNIGNILT